MTVHALSRKAGPISAIPKDPPATSQSHDPDQPVPVTDRLDTIKDDTRALANSFFGDNATLLGLIKLSDLVEAIITLAGGRVPVLQELVEYGGGLAGDADALIRERVLAPLQQALNALNDPMTKSDQSPGGRRSMSAKSTRTLSKLHRTEKERPGRNRRAAAVVDDGAGDTISTYTAVYTDGRSFVNAIERALRDPITPLREAAKGWLNEQIARG